MVNPTEQMFKWVRDDARIDVQLPSNWLTIVSTTRRLISSNTQDARHTCSMLNVQCTLSEVHSHCYWGLTSLDNVH